VMMLSPGPSLSRTTAAPTLCAVMRRAGLLQAVLWPDGHDDLVHSVSHEHRVAPLCRASGAVRSKGLRGESGAVRLDTSRMLLSCTITHFSLSCQLIQACEGDQSEGMGSAQSQSRAPIDVWL
jgi:hypothetical protein